MIVPFPAGGPTDTLGAHRWPSACGRRSASRSSSRTSAAPAAASASAGSRAPRPTATRSIIGNWSTHVVNGAIYSLPYDVLNDFEPIALLTDSSADDRRAARAMPANDLQGADRLAQGQPRQGDGRHRRRRQPAARRRRPVPEGSPARASSSCPIAAARRRCRTWSPARSTCVIADPATLAAAGARRHHQGLCGHRQEPPAGGAGHADRRRGRAAGLPRLDLERVWAPKGTPKDIIARLNAAVVEALADPAVRARLADLGQDMPSRASSRRRRRSRALHKAEIEKWWPIIKAANIRSE